MLKFNIHDSLISWLGTDTSIKGGGVYLVSGAQAFHLIEEHRRSNHEWTIQRHQQHLAYNTQ
jgi:hypothetical protein